jgi:two-component system CheB/CheR fusion protein
MNEKIFQPVSWFWHILAETFPFRLRERKGWSIRLHLVLLAVAIMAPLMFLAGLTINNHVETARRSLYLDAQRIADNVTANIEREMSSILTLLNVLAQDTAFDRGEYEALYNRTKEGLKGRRGIVVLFGQGDKALFSTRFDYGTNLPESSNDGTAEQILRTKRPQVSNLFFGRAAQRQIFTAAVPIMRGGQVVGRLNLALEPQDLTEAVALSGIEPSWGYSVADRNLVYVLSSDPTHHPTGQPIKKSIIEQMKSDAGQFRSVTASGEPLLTAYRKSAIMGWTTFTAIPLALVERPLEKVWTNFTLAGLVALTISLLAAYGCSRAMTQPIQSLVDAAGAFGGGHDVPPLHSRLREANLLSTALIDAAAQLRGRAAALAESERRFRLLAGQTSDVIWFADIDTGGLDYVSPAFETISGRPLAEIATMEHWRRTVHPDDLPAFDNRFRGEFEESMIEYRMLRPGCGIRWVQDTRFPLEAGTRRPRIVAGILRDITARKEALDALTAAQAEAEARLEELENLYRNAPIGLALLDPDCRLVRINAFLAAMSPAPKDDYVSKPFFELFPDLEETARPRCQELLQTGVAVRNLEIETHKQDPNGSQHFLAHLYPIHAHNDGVSGIGVILENITERKHTEQALNRLAAIVYAASDAMFSIAPTGRIQNWNPAAATLFQYEQHEVIGQPFSFLFPETSQQDYERLTKAWEAGESRRLDIEMRRKDETVFPASISIAPIKDGEKTIAVSTTIEDITERRSWEKRQLLMNRELSHRVKNTLAVIQAMARHTLRSAADPAAFTAAFEGRLRALSISHNLLTSSQWEGAEIGELAREQLGPHASGAGRIRLQGPTLLIPPGMATTLGLVLHELATNAAKYGALSLPAGKVTLSWRVEPGTPQRCLVIEWTEQGGPAVTPPERRGFGSVLIENSGKVEQYFEPGGLRCAIEMALMEGGGSQASF